MALPHGARQSNPCSDLRFKGINHLANCKDCGKRLTLFDAVDGRCSSCHFNRNTEETSTAPSEYQQRLAAAENVLLTTETGCSLPIEQRFGIVAAECAFGMHIFKDLFALGRDVFGGRSESIQNTLKDARKTALSELQAEALALGGNAVIGVSLDYSEISGGGKSMLFIAATGTAVILRS